MGVTIHVNGTSNSLVHKGSMGIAKSTIPDVCKTPSPGGPVPIPYPVIISMSSDLAKGTKTVKVDSGNSAAIKGSEFSRCMGDEPGTAGGVKSSTNMKEATWLLYSFDVKLDGKNACRLSDKMMMNHGNTVCLAGCINPPVIAAIGQEEADELCTIMCKCNKEPVKSETGRNMKQECVKKRLDEKDTPPGSSDLKAEVSYNMKKLPPKPFMHREAGVDTLERSHNWQRRANSEISRYARGKGMVRRPDVVAVLDKAKPPTQDNIKAIIEMKFPGDPVDGNQLKAYEKIAGSAPVEVLSIEKCECD